MTVLMYDLRLKNIPAEVWMGILVLACTILLFTSGVKNVLPASGSVEKKVILIDAGHGGDDPGKIGINQAKEKDINLAIAKKLKVCLEKAGFEQIRLDLGISKRIYTENDEFYNPTPLFCIAATKNQY